VPAGERLGNRFGVGALAQPHPHARRREFPHVRLGAAQRRLYHAADEREPGPQRGRDPQPGVGRRVVLRVHRHGRPRLARRDGDPLDVVARHALVEQQADGGRLHRHLDRAALGEPLGGQLAEQLHVLRGGTVGQP
jgi:hypothetical protein